MFRLTVDYQIKDRRGPHRRGVREHGATVAIRAYLFALTRPACNSSHSDRTADRSAMPTTSGVELASKIRAQRAAKCAGWRASKLACNCSCRICPL